MASSPDSKKDDLETNTVTSYESPGVVEDVVRPVDHKAERALCRRFDFRLLPILALMCMFYLSHLIYEVMLIYTMIDLFNALDKGNLGNAQTDGLSKDLHFEPGQYNLLLSIFFVPYVIFAPPLAMLGKRFGPARVLPLLMFTFGS